MYADPTTSKPLLVFAENPTIEIRTVLRQTTATQQTVAMAVWQTPCDVMQQTAAMQQTTLQQTPAMQQTPCDVMQQTAAMAVQQTPATQQTAALQRTTATSAMAA